MPATKPTFVALHVATSGPDPDRDAVVAIDAARFVRTRITATLHCDVRPDVDVANATRAPLGAVPLGQALDELERFVGHDILVGHDLTAGLHVLRRHGAMLRAAGYDLGELADVLDVAARDATVEALLERFDVVPAGEDQTAVGPGGQTTPGGQGGQTTPDDPNGQTTPVDPSGQTTPADPSGQTTPDDLIGRLAPTSVEHGRLYLALLDRARDVRHDVLEAIVTIGEHASWPLAPVFRAAADSPRHERTPATDATSPKRSSQVPSSQVPSSHVPSSHVSLSPEPSSQEPSSPEPPSHVSLSPEPSSPEQTSREPSLQISSSPKPSSPEPSSPRLRRRDPPVPVDKEALDALIAPDGRLAEAIPGFEDRAGQRDMLRAVCDAFNRGDQLLVEAGTGTGKSLAYLLPAAAFAQANGVHVVVATHTIALQDQLLHSDLPVVSRLLGGDFTFAVLKGRPNYLCRTRVAGLPAREDWGVEDVPTVARLLVWSSTTTTGDRAELRLRPPESAIWRAVHADADVCTSETCSFAATGSCWVHLARARAAAAHVIVVSHALLVSDARVNNRLLPPHEHLVIDEAHHLEAVATDALGFSVSRLRARQALGSRALSGQRGLLARVATSFAASDAGDELRAEVWSSVTALRELAKRTALEADGLFDAVAVFLDSCDGAAGAQVRLTEAHRHRREWFPVEAAWDGLHAHAVELRKGIVRLMQGLSAAELYLDEGDTLVAELQAAAREIADIDAGLERAIVQPVANDVVWATRQDDRRVSIHRAPLFVGETLERWLFGDKDTLILTSATLRTGDGFRFLRERLALHDAPELVVESPFDFDRSTLVFTPTDMPPPGAPGYQDALDTALVNLASALGGRALVLFTSHHGLRTTYHNVRAPLGAIGIRTLGQGMDGPRHALLEQFRDTSRPAVLLGTRSFWEGIDVPGEALSGLVMARLPFDVPTDPVFAARAETFDDPFREYSVPLAVLRFRQGFGRLIRTRSDRGIVAVLDSRVLSKSYGHVFLSSLPPCRQCKGTLAELPMVARRFLGDEPLE